MLQVQCMEGGVGHRVRGERNGGEAAEPTVGADGSDHEEDGERQAQSTDVAGEVLVVGRQRRYPRVSGRGKATEELCRPDQRPDADGALTQGQDAQRHPRQPGPDRGTVDGAHRTDLASVGV